MFRFSFWVWSLSVALHLEWRSNIIIKEVDSPKLSSTRIDKAAAVGLLKHPANTKYSHLEHLEKCFVRIITPFLIYELAEQSTNDNFTQRKAEASFSSASMHYTPYGQNEENHYRTTAYLKIWNTRGWLVKIQVSCQTISDRCRIF